MICDSPAVGQFAFWGEDFDRTGSLHSNAMRTGVMVSVPDGIGWAEECDWNGTLFAHSYTDGALYLKLMNTNLRSLLVCSV